MKSFLFFLLSLLILSCSDETVSSIEQNNGTNNSISKDTITTSLLRFVSSSGQGSGEITGYYTGMLPVVKINAYGVWSGCVTVSGDLTSNGSIQANNYSSSTGKQGKTYTEEFEDKQGNIRTRVYENGLLVSYKINGVEQ